MNPKIHEEVLKRLKQEFRFEESKDYLRKGKCPGPGCGKRELYTRIDRPWILRCGRLDKCGYEGHVKELFPDIFDDWSKRFKRTERDPNAAADAYLSHARGFDLMRLRGAYSEEYYRDEELKIGSATVRFPLPGGGWWQRLIDQPGRFGKKKATFSYGTGYRGHVWTLPGLTLEHYADADQIWFGEGIFDAIALHQSGSLVSASCMSSNNYPELFLAELHKIIAARGAEARRPKLIFAFDVGAAGVSFTRKFVERARKEGWECGAAQVRADGEGDKLDWNDLAQRDRLKPEDLASYLWAGDVTIAETASEKAFLLYSKDRYSSFPLTFKSRQLWASFNIGRIEELVAGYDEDKTLTGLTYEQKWDLAAKESAEISEIANCTFRALYFQRDEAVDDSCYYFRVDFPSKQPSVKATFSGASIAAGAEFKKRLISIAPGAIWTGSTNQLDRLMQSQLVAIRTVEAIQFTGYSVDHGAYVFGEMGVFQGRVFEKNADDYFEFGKVSIKLRSSERLLRISYDPQALDTSWLDDLILGFGSKGLVALAFWFGSLFAEQIRAAQESLGFLEITGPPGSGKTTLIAFLWKLLGRTGNYEGFDPAKATAAAIARNLGKVANMPVVLIEGDRNQETSHARRFEWDELKTAYNGRSVRARGVANGGMETFEPPFRGAIAIVQNDPVDASDAITERIMNIHFDKGGWSPETKAAAERLSRIEMEAISGFIIHAVRREEKVLALYRERFAFHEKAMLAEPEIRNGRLAKNHAQVAAMVDALTLILPNLGRHDVQAAQQFIRTMLKERHKRVSKDHPSVELFWERYDWIHGVTGDGDNSINHSRSNDMIAINLVQFEQKCSDGGLRLPPMNELKKLLRGSKARKFIASKTVNSHTGKTLHCWCFENPDPKR